MTILIFQQSLYSQKEIVGKVEFYKSIESDWKILESFPDATIEKLTNRNHKIKIEENKVKTEIETDSTGIFKITLGLKDSILIKINDHSPVLNKEFEFMPNQIKDTLKLRISDKRLCIYRDSISEPKFFAKYNEKQAELDFKNGKKQLLGIAVDWPTKESTQRREEIVAEYGIEYDYFFQPTREKIKIMYRYNQVIKRLIGINKNVW